MQKYCANAEWHCEKCDDPKCPAFPHHYDSREADARDVERLAEIAKLKEALRKYGKHQNNSGHFCSLLRHSEYQCDCGFDELRRSL